MGFFCLKQNGGLLVLGNDEQTAAQPQHWFIPVVYQPYWAWMIPKKNSELQRNKGWLRTFAPSCEFACVPVLYFCSLLVLSQHKIPISPQTSSLMLNRKLTFKIRWRNLHTHGRKAACNCLHWGGGGVMGGFISLYVTCCHDISLVIFKHHLIY